MSDEQRQPTKTYLEVFADGKWKSVEDFPEDDGRALRAFVKQRDANPTARYRITNEAAQVLLDLPPVGQS